MRGGFTPAFWRMRLLALFLLRQRRGPGRGRAAAGADVGRPAPGVLVGAELVQLRRATLRRLAVQLLQERHAPAAAGARPAALRQLAGHARPLDAQEVQQLPPADVEAVADFLV